MPRDQRHQGKFEKELAVFEALKVYDEWPVGFPELIYHGKTNYFYFYVMERLGTSLKKMHSLCKNSKMDLKNVIKIAIQLIERLQILHGAGLVRILIFNILGT